MQTRMLGALEVSVVGLGCNNFGMRIDADQTRRVVDAAIEAGITYFDTAEAYGGGQSEEFLGAALAGRRDEVLIATKWGMTPPEDGPPNGSAAAIRTALEGSLRRLGTDRVDHYQLHRPDPDTPVAETLGALQQLRDEGKIGEIGCSNFDAGQLDEAVGAASDDTAGFASVQNHYSLLTRTPETDGVLTACERHGIGFVPYFPLESGVLTGKYLADRPPPEGSRLAAWGDRAAGFLDTDRLATVARISAWAGDRGHTVLDAAMSWLTTNPLVTTTIAGATTPEQVRANVTAAGWAMTDAERTELDSLR